VLTLTPRGRAKVRLVHENANARVHHALASLPDAEREVVVRGLQLYARALERSRRLASLSIRPVRAADKAAVARIIRTVMPEFGAKGPGFASMDPEVSDMYSAYRAPRSAYFVVVQRADGAKKARPSETVVGGGGYAPLLGGDADTCELRKMYLLRDARGLGLGQTLLETCIDGARGAGFRRMYLETLENMTQARALYERNGFVRLERPMGRTGHHGCNAFYVLDLA
jgi:putative acetyltransferase